MYNGLFVKSLEQGVDRQACPAPSFGDALSTVLKMDGHSFNPPGLEQPQTAGPTYGRVSLAQGKPFSQAC